MYGVDCDAGQKHSCLIDDDLSFVAQAMKKNHYNRSKKGLKY